ncbi:M24 family metallopeptidase [Desulfitibacter alkalitolerans]|uniref:M24 family metallopeptidase n=1 Tax=Desulfitibacter alkalitolerans TaxID=264641 RepID=UPI0004886276|nr:Xaa-Pro peptidase family protein [Desulfitibacter alkalitolerans]
MNDFSREINDRIIKLQHKIRESELTGVLLTERTNVYYFSGSGQQCHLYVPSEGKPLLMVKKTLEKAMDESPLEYITLLNSPKEIPQVLAEHDLKINGRIAMELDVLPANSYFFYKKVLEGSEIVDVSVMIRDLRMIKSEYEISLIRESGTKHGEVFKYIGSAIKEGMSDRELAGAIEGYARKIGHLGYTRFRGFNVEFYFGHALVGAAGAASGPYDVMATVGAGSHPTFPQGVSGALIKKGEPIYIDYVGNYTGYLVDQSRSFILGELPPIVEKAADVSMEIQSMLQDSLKEGINGRYLYDSSISIVEKSGLRDYFMGYPKGVPFIGHGIGLEVNEWPVIAKGFEIELKSGMVIALEPKFIFPGMGVVGVENTYLVLKKGFEQLTKGEDTIRYI